MPQRKKSIEWTGIYPALRADLTSVANKFPNDIDALVRRLGPRVREHHDYIHGTVHTRPCTRAAYLDVVIDLLASLAVAPNAGLTRATIRRDLLFNCYAAAPDLTLAVLAKARSIWFKRSKARRIMNFMAEGCEVPHAPNKNIFEAVDGEVALAFALKTKEQVSTSDVVKARKKLRADVLRGLKTE
jgi:hypothetical protein